MTLLRLEAASFMEAGAASLAPVSLEVSSGEIVVVEAPEIVAGAVLAHGCLGFLPPQSGQVWLFGERLAGRADAQLSHLRRRAALSTSSLPLLANQTVRDNIGIPLLMRGLPAAGTRSLVSALLERFGIEHCGLKRPHEITQREHELALAARALAVPADLVVLDNPRLPPAARGLLQDKIDAGSAVLAIVTHAALIPEAVRKIPVELA